MALKTKKSIFYHIPKTGGTWVRKVMSLNKMGERETLGTGSHPLGLERKHTTPEFTSDEDKEGLFSYAFVRNPLGWYKSFWNFRMDREGGPLVRKAQVYNKFIIDECWDDDFNKFIDNVIERVPNGFVTQLYKYYLGEDGNDLDFVGRQETLNKDLLIALKLAGEEVDESIINGLKPRNTSAMYCEEIKQETFFKILEVEKWVMNKFYKH